jgi:putative oxidoreductase
LAILAPVLVNIWSYHLLMFPHTYQLAVLATVLWIFLFYYYRRHFAGLFVQRA